MTAARVPAGASFRSGAPLHYETRAPGAGGRLGARTSQSRWISRTGQVDGVLMRWPDSAAIKDSQGLFMAVE